MLRKSPEALTAIIIALLSLILSAYSGYNHNDKEMTSRIAVLETHRTDDKERLDRIETKIDSLLHWAGVK